MKSALGPLLVGLGSLLWATDALVRVPSIAKSDPLFIVFIEHFIGFIALLPLFLFISPKKLLALGGWRNWLACVVVGAGGSAIALLLFTEAFRFMSPTLNILLQKTQPILVVMIARWFLKEKTEEGFYFWASIAVISCVILNLTESGNPDFSGNSSLLKGIVFSLGASAVWAISTVTGKRLLDDLDPLIATFWRFFFGLLTLSLMLGFTQGFSQLQTLSDPQFRFNYLYLGLFPGVIAMWTYYSGMKRTSATVTTIVELIFPVGAMYLNYVFLGTKLGPIQGVFSLILLFSVMSISLKSPLKLKIAPKPADQSSESP
ncbi:DMT family transporter [bacterium]|nr:DMT family transporter [bacterium]